MIEASFQLYLKRRENYSKNKPKPAIFFLHISENIYKIKIFSFKVHSLIYQKKKKSIYSHCFAIKETIQIIQNNEDKKT